MQTAQSVPAFPQLFYHLLQSKIDKKEKVYKPHYDFHLLEDIDSS